MAASPSRFPASDHYDGQRFFNPRGDFPHSLLRLLRWKLGAKPTPWPAHVEVSPTVPPPSPRDDRIVATWVNHATFLLQTRQGNFLTDPVWSERAGPWRFGPRRVHVPGIRFEDLPKIDAVLLSHDHYDHCDVTTLRRLSERDAPLIIAPLGHRDLLLSAGVAPEKITELDWWQTAAPKSLSSSPPISTASTTGASGFPVSITLTPSRHWTNRLGRPANSRLWGGFFLRLGQRSIWFAGDTGYDPLTFKEIGQRLGAPDLALIPIGAYEPRWFMEAAHCNPTEAVQIHRDVGAARSLGMHWGTFQLTDEGRDDPPRALAAACAAAHVAADAFKVLAPGAFATV